MLEHLSIAPSVTVYRLEPSREKAHACTLNASSQLSRDRLFVTQMDSSMPGFPLLYYLLEVVQTHVHWVDDAIQPSHPLSPTSPPALSLSQHWSLFHLVSCLHQVAKVLELLLQHQSFQWIFRVDLGLTGLIFLLSKGPSRVFSSTTHQASYLTFKCHGVLILNGNNNIPPY